MVILDDCLPLATETNDELALLTIYLAQGICIDVLGQPQKAAKAFRRGTQICERRGFTDGANEDAIHLASGIYSTFAQFEQRRGHMDEACQIARTAIRWAMRSADHNLHAVHLTLAGGVLATNHGYADALPALREAYHDAVQLGLSDYPYMAAHYISVAIADSAYQADSLAQLAAAAAPITEDVPHQGTTGGSPPTTNAPATVGSPPTTNVPHRGTTGGPTWGSVWLLLPIFIIAIASTIYISRRKRREIAQLRQTAEQRFVEGQEQERSRLAKELHDGVSNQLLAVEMKLQSDGQTTQTMQLLRESREQVRHVSHQLMPPDFEQCTLDETLASYTAELDGAGGCHISFRKEPLDAGWSFLPSDKALSIYRIVQEVVANILKHAGATEACIVLQQGDNNKSTITIADNGTRTASVGDTHGIGMRTIRQRAKAIGAKITTHGVCGAYMCTIEI